MYLGERLEDIEVTSEVEVRLGDEERILLPYGYVVHSGRLMLTPGIVEYLSREHP
ncbi:MAG: hypothetical protein GXO66_10730 [Euryarchaeota archaeon]|nr:hypothetical protein [Euryarchaeota archaeon]